MRTCALMMVHGRKSPALASWGLFYKSPKRYINAVKIPRWSFKAVCLREIRLLASYCYPVFLIFNTVTGPRFGGRGRTGGRIELGEIVFALKNGRPLRPVEKALDLYARLFSRKTGNYLRYCVPVWLIQDANLFICFIPYTPIKVYVSVIQDN